jgi:lambda family phage minor tail protein L
MKQSVAQELTRFNPSALIELFELDATAIGGDVFRFHGGTTNNFTPIVFDSLEYMPYPILVEGFEMDGKGSLPRPKLRAANTNGYLSFFILNGMDFAGAKLSRKRVFARYLDDVNFENGVNPYGTADPFAAFPDDVFFINRKVAENNDYIEFELATQLEIDNVKLPKRQIFAHICSFKYRESPCPYAGIPVADKNNNTFADFYGMTLTNMGEYDKNDVYNRGNYVYVTSLLPQTYGQKIFFVCLENGTSGKDFGPNGKNSKWIADFCPKNLNGCRLRFPSPEILPFGGFPGTASGPLKNE